ncbi:hypothetical protein ACH5RR_007542 [Cinchona calisaya]|uniref:Uncharacterized protein n=1 Tax=Cinchona calisaya TaxID=153742 RepID=A0ABD3ASH6_9GENT
MCLLPLGLAYSYDFDVLVIPMVVLCAATFLFGPVITVLMVRMREFIHHYFFRLLFPRHLAALFIFAYNRLVVGGDRTVVFYLTGILASIISFMGLFLDHGYVRTALDGIAASSGTAVVELALMHSRLLEAYTALVPYLLSMILLLFGWFEIEGETFRGYLIWPVAARHFTRNLLHRGKHYMWSILLHGGERHYMSSLMEGWVHTEVPHRRQSVLEDV